MPTEIDETLNQDDLVKERYHVVIKGLKTKIDYATESYEDLINITDSVSLASDIILITKS